MTLHAVRHFADLSVGPNATCFILSSGQISPAGVIVLPHKGKKLCLWPQTAFVMWLAYDATLSLSYSLAWLERFRRSYRVRSVEDLASFVINVWLLASLSPMVSMVRQEPSACWRFSRMEIRDGGCARWEANSPAPDVWCNAITLNRTVQRTRNLPYRTPTTLMSLVKLPIKNMRPAAMLKE